MIFLVNTLCVFLLKVLVLLKVILAQLVHTLNKNKCIFFHFLTSLVIDLICEPHASGVARIYLFNVTASILSVTV